MDLPAGAMVSAIALETHHERYRPLDPHRLRDAHEHPPRTTTRESLQEALHAFYASLTNSKDQEWNEEGWSKDFIEGWAKSHQKKILPMRSMPRIQRKEDPEGSVDDLRKSSSRRPDVCFRCNKTGHIARYCKEL